MGAVFEHYTSNLEIAFPFEDAFQGPESRLFVDAVVYHTANRTKGRLRLDKFKPTAAPYQLKLVFDDSTVLADFSTSNLPGEPVFFTTTFGPWTIYEWKKISPLTDGAPTYEVLARFVVKTDRIGDFVYPLLPAAAFLVSSLVLPRALRVRRVAVKQPGVPCCLGGGFGQGAVRLEAGYNIQLTPKAPDSVGVGVDTADPLRLPTVVQIDAVAGDGLGRFPLCQTAPTDIKTIKAVRPDPSTGNFQLDGKDCLWWERPLISSGPAIHPHTDYSGAVLPSTIKLHADCRPCCDCRDYQAAYEELRRLWNRALRTAAWVESTRKQYNDTVHLLNAIYSSAHCPDLRVELSLMARPDFHLAIGGIIGNGTHFDLHHLTIKFIISVGGFVYTTGSGVLDTESGHNVPVALAVSGSTAALALPILRSGKQVGISFSIRYPTGTPRVGGVVSVTLQVQSTLGTVNVVKGIVLNQPLEKT